MILQKFGKGARMTVIGKKTILYFAFSLLILLPTPVSAHIGTDIGISFPVGGGTESAASGGQESYASFSHCGIIEELMATERHGRLMIEYKVTNTTDSPYCISHRDGQIYDFALLDKNGKALWHWSDHMAFTQALCTSSVAAHSDEIYTASIERSEYKKLKEDAVLVAAWLKDTEYCLSTRIPSSGKVKNTGSAVRGTIIIGNGHWYHD